MSTIIQSFTLANPITQDEANEVVARFQQTKWFQYWGGEFTFHSGLYSCWFLWKMTNPDDKISREEYDQIRDWIDDTVTELRFSSKN